MTPRTSASPEAFKHALEMRLRTAARLRQVAGPGAALTESLTRLAPHRCPLIEAQERP